MRRPLTMNGSVPGMTSEVKMSREDARKLRDTSRRWRSTVRTPSTVGRMIAKKPPRKTTTAFMFQSSPNHRTTSGTSATRGSALKKFNHGSNVSDRRRYHRMSAGRGLRTRGWIVRNAGLVATVTRSVRRGGDALAHGLTPKALAHVDVPLVEDRRAAQEREARDALHLTARVRCPAALREH